MKQFHCHHLNSLDASLDMDNYYEPLKISVERKEVIGILQRNVPEVKITFQNKKRVAVGRQAAANVIRTEGGVMGCPMCSPPRARG